MNLLALLLVPIACSPEPDLPAFDRSPGNPGTEGDSGSGSGGSSTGGDGSGDGTGNGTGSGGGDTGSAPEWVVLPDDCAPPSPDGVDPFTITGRVNNTQTGPGQWFVEHLDLAWLPDEQRVLATGQGGLVVYDVVPDADPVTRGHVGAGGGAYDRYYQLLPAEPGLVWTTHRGFGLDTFDVSDPDIPVQLSSSEANGYEGLGRHAGWLYVADTDGQVDVYDVSDPRAPVLAGSVTGLGRPWDVHVVDGTAYVADGDLGVVALDLSTPAAPVVAGIAESGGMPVRLDADGDGHLYVASGAGGLEILDISTPLMPALVAQVDVGGGALDVATDDGIVGVATQEAVVLLDVGRAGSPADPLPHAYEQTEQFAMTLDAEDGVWVVGDWNILGTWSLAPTPAPAIDISQSMVAFLDEAESREIELRNRGGGILDLAGIDVPDGISARVSSASVASGEAAVLELSWDGATPLAGAQVCISSDDPGRPAVRIPVMGSLEGEGRLIGQMAPDFALEDLDGTVHRLSEQRGHPVVLAYFTTW